MKNIISTRLPGIIDQAQVILPALTRNGPGLGLSHINATTLSDHLNEVIAAREATNTAKAVLGDKRRALRNLFQGGRRYATTARDILKFHLGKQPSMLWEVAGFRGSLAIPRTIMPLVGTLRLLSKYLAKYPQQQNAALEVTTERANLWVTQMIEAVVAVNKERSRVESLIADRDAKLARVRRDLRTLLAELKMSMEPDDARWAEFNFRKPAATHQPESPKEVTVTPVAPGAVLVKIKRPAYAERYRVWQRVIGMEDEFTLMETRHDREFALVGLPLNREIEIAVSAVNSAGESARSAAIKLTSDSRGVFDRMLHDR